MDELGGFLVVWLILAAGVAGFAASRGKSAVSYFLLSLLLSPLIGFIVAAVSGGTAPKPTVSTAHLTELADLRDRGVLTEDEFQAKKSELLARM